jgi:hypothetical protein
MFLPEDDHDIHLEQDDLFMVSAEFLDLPEEVRNAYREHKTQHEEFRSQQLASYAEQATQLSGGASSASGGPPAAKRGIESPTDGGWSTYPEPSEITPGPTGGMG